MTDCPKCRGTGVAHRSPYIMGTRDGDLYSIVFCDCGAGQTQVAAMNAALAGWVRVSDRGGDA